MCNFTPVCSKHVLQTGLTPTKQHNNKATNQRSNEATLLECAVSMYRKQGKHDVQPSRHPGIIVMQSKLVLDQVFYVDQDV